MSIYIFFSFGPNNKMVYCAEFHDFLFALESKLTLVVLCFHSRVKYNVL